jgi:hypothetical protein
MLPVRRGEVSRREKARDGDQKWTRFYHDLDRLVESCDHFCDRHWVWEDESELIDKLKDYAKTSAYKTRSQLEEERNARGYTPAEEQDDDVGSGSGSPMGTTGGQDEPQYEQGENSPPNDEDVQQGGDNGIVASSVDDDDNYLDYEPPRPAGADRGFDD